MSSFGSTGAWRVIVNGVPFRADGATYEEAEANVLDTLSANPRLFAMRTRNLGLDDDDVEALRVGFDAGSQTAGDAAFSQANAGRVRAKEAGGSGAEKLYIGLGRRTVDMYKGFRQVVSEAMGNEAAAAAIETEDHDNRRLYEELDKTGVGAEDLGEIGADIAALVGLSAIAPVAVSGAAAGVPFAAGAGALVAASSVKQDATMMDRGIDAALGAGGALLGPAVHKTAQGIGALGRMVRPGVSIPVAKTGMWLRLLGATRKGGATANAVEEALTLIQTSDPGKQLIGREALSRVQRIVAELPAEATQGLKNEALFGTLRKAVAKSVTRTPGGVNVFDGATFEREATALIGQLGKMFDDVGHRNAVAAIGTLAKSMQGLPDEVAIRAAERAAVALAAAPAESEAFRLALGKATNVAVRETLIDGLANIGDNVLRDTAGVAQRAFSATMAGAPVGAINQASQTVEEETR